MTISSSGLYRDASQPLFQRYQRWVTATEPLHAPAAEPLAFPVLPSAVEAS